MQHNYPWALSALIFALFAAAACGGQEATPEVIAVTPAVATPAQADVATPAEPAEPAAVPTSTPDPAQAAGPEITFADLDIDPAAAAAFGGIALLPLDDAPGQRLWAAFTVGSRSYDPDQGHVVALFAETAAGHQKLAQLDLAAGTGQEDGPLGPDYLSDNSLAQVPVEPDHLWLQVQGGIGAHGGTYQLLTFDGTQLTLQVAGSSASPGTSRVQDLNGDGLLEAILDTTDYYVFCYACSVRLIQHDVYRWDGAAMVPVDLAPLPADAPPELHEPNNRAVELAQAGLWKDALATIQQATAQPDQDETVAWNAALIRLTAEARRDAAGPYPLLDHIFYGDYPAAVDLMRDYEPNQIFSADTPLVTGTVAMGWEPALVEHIDAHTSDALQAQPDLPGAHFLRGWAAGLLTPSAPAALAGMEQAVQLAPDDPLFTASVAYLRALAGGQATALDTLNVRAGPGADQPIIGTLAEGDTVRIVGQSLEGNWWHIIYPDGSAQRAWIIADPQRVAAAQAGAVPTIQPAAQAAGRIFYSALDPEGRNTIFALQIGAQSGPELVVTHAAQPALQPGGQRLAFHSSQEDRLGLAGIDLNTDQIIRFTTHLEDITPSWNPQGDRLIFASDRHGDRGWRLYLTWADGRDEADVLGFGLDPNWHPSAGRIVYKGCDEAGARCGLWTMDSAGNDLRPLTDVASDSRPVWSPDGAFVVFMSEARDGNWELYRVDVSSGAVTRLTDDPALDGLPAIGPAGRQVAFVSNRGDEWGLYLLPAGGGAPQRLLSLGPDLPNWLEQGVHWAH